MRFPLAPLTACAALAFAGAPISHAADLFNGKDLTGWSLVANPPTDIAQVCKVTPEGTMSVAGKPIGYLLVAGTQKNYRLHVEWRWPKDPSPKSNGGVLLHISSGPIGGKAWPICHQAQLQIHRAGDMIPMAGAKFSEPFSTPPGAKTPKLDRKQPDSEKPFGEWNAYDIVCRDGAIECSVNGVLQNRVTGCEPSSGQIGFQLEGTPFELRNITLELLE